MSAETGIENSESRLRNTCMLVYIRIVLSFVGTSIDMSRSPMQEMLLSR
jgi:hypothetical protein